MLTRFSLGSICNWYGATDSREVSLKGNVYDFSVDYNPMNKSDILNILKYSVFKYLKIIWNNDLVY